MNMFREPAGTGRRGIRAPATGNIVQDHFCAANSDCQLSTTVKGGAVVCSTGTATRKRRPSLVAFASENQAAGVRNRSWGMPGRNVAPEVTSADINAPSGDV